MFTHERMMSVDDDADFDRLAMACMRFIKTKDAFPWSSEDLTDEGRIAELRTGLKDDEADPKTPATFGWKTFWEGYPVACCYGFVNDGIFYAKIALFGADISGSRRWTWDRSQQAPLTVMLEANGIHTFRVQSYAANTSLNNYLINGKGIADSEFVPAAHDGDIDQVTFNLR